MPADIAHRTLEEKDEYLLETTAFDEEKSSDFQDRPAPLMPSGHASGTQLRHRFVTPETIAELAASERPSLLQRLLRRK